MSKTFHETKGKMTDRQIMILTTAQGLFARFGLKKVTTDDIAREAHVSKATIYRYFPNKTEIFEEVVRMETEELLTAVRAAIDRESTVFDKFRTHLMTRMSKLHELLNFYNVTQQTLHDYWPHIAEVRTRLMREERKIVQGIIREGNRTGELAVKDIDLVAHILVVALQSVEYPWAIDEHGISLKRYVDTMLRMMMNGLKKRSIYAGTN